MKVVNIWCYVSLISHENNSKTKVDEDKRGMQRYVNDDEKLKRWCTYVILAEISIENRGEMQRCYVSYWLRLLMRLEGNGKESGLINYSFILLCI